MKYTMVVCALALCLQASTARAVVLVGEVAGIVPTTIPWVDSGVTAGDSFLFRFRIDTSVEAISPTALHDVGPVARDIDTFGLEVELLINGVEALKGEHGNDAAVAGPGTAPIGALSVDSVVGQLLINPDEMFTFALYVPGLIDDPVPDFPLTALTFDDITGASFGFIDADEPTTSLILIADNLPVTQVPEPSTWALAAVGLAALAGAGRRLRYRRHGAHGHRQGLVVSG